MYSRELVLTVEMLAARVPVLYRRKELSVLNHERNITEAFFKKMECSVDPNKDEIYSRRKTLSLAWPVKRASRKKQLGKEIVGFFPSTFLFLRSSYESRTVFTERAYLKLLPETETTALALHKELIPKPLEYYA